jgi:hypothetical protein
MSLVNIGSIRLQALRMLDKQTAPGSGLELFTYKRDRGVGIVRLDADTFLVREHGFVDQESEVKRAGLPKLLKTIIKREFPRSHKVRVIPFDGSDNRKF